MWKRALFAVSTTWSISFLYVLILFGIVRAKCSKEVAGSVFELKVPLEPDTSIYLLAFKVSLGWTGPVLPLSFVGYKTSFSWKFVKGLLFLAALGLLFVAAFIQPLIRFIGNGDPEWDSPPEWLVAKGIYFVHILGVYFILSLLFAFTELIKIRKK